MTAYTIALRKAGMVWTWHDVSDAEMQILILAFGAAPDGIGADGPFVNLLAGIPYRFSNLSPAVVQRVLGRPATSLLRDTHSEGHGG